MAQKPLFGVRYSDLQIGNTSLVTYDAKDPNSGWVVVQPLPHPPRRVHLLVLPY